MENSFFPKNVLENNAVELSLEGIAAKFSYFHLQMHLFHLQTNSFAEHKALDFYSNLVDIKDEFLEKIQGYLGRRVKAHKIEPLCDYSIGCTNTLVNDMQIFSNDLKAFGEKNKMHDVCNLADSFSGDIAKLKYLLTLS